MKRNFGKITLFILFLFMFGGLYITAPWEITAGDVHTVRADGKASASGRTEAVMDGKALISEETNPTSGGGIVTPGCIEAPVNVASPSVVVVATGYAVTHGVAGLQEAVCWANKLSVGAEILLTGEEEEYILSQPIHSNVMLTIPEEKQLLVVTGQAVTMAGIIDNQGTLQTEGKLVNTGCLKNSGVWNNLTLSENRALIYNSGKIFNKDIILNSGFINNEGEIQGGSITEDGVYMGNPAKLDDFIVKTCNVVYDGMGHAMIESVEAQEGDRIEYSRDGENYSEEMPQITYVNDAKKVFVRVLRGSIYEWRSEELEATVRPAFPFFTVPELTAVHGQTLGDIAAGLPAGMEFERSASTSVGIVGKHIFRARYTPADTINYVKVIGIQVNVNVVKSAIQLEQDKIYLPRTVIKKGKLVYSVTKGIVGDCRVKVTRAKKKTYKQIEIPAVIKAGGITYKVAKIDNKAFAYNKKLEKVVIGKNVKSIDDRAFAEDRKLKKIVIKSTVLKTVGKKVTRHLSPNTKIYVPKKYYSKYKRLILKGRTVKNIKFYKR